MELLAAKAGCAFAAIMAAAALTKASAPKSRREMNVMAVLLMLDRRQPDVTELHRAGLDFQSDPPRQFNDVRAFVDEFAVEGDLHGVAIDRHFHGVPLAHGLLGILDPKVAPDMS